MTLTLGIFGMESGALGWFIGAQLMAGVMAQKAQATWFLLQALRVKLSGYQAELFRRYNSERYSV
ncbi:hypothetical protein [Photobacterium sp. J15]|uniref:hypothetical protein n=1 Tax=Photobacterium sp. J15 TaxID=265901 RepID=UPI0012ED4DCD|nr:hypothetical protein [Photobacterium sp. J15]